MASFFFFDFLQQIRSEYEVVQTLVCGREYLVFGSFPFFMALVDKNDTVANSHHRIHVVGIDDGGHVVFGGDVVNQFVNDQ